MLALPEDMLTEAVAAMPAATRYQRVAASPSGAQIEKLRELLAHAKKPFVIAGGSGWTEEATRDFARFAERWQLPVGCAFRYQDTLNNEHPNYAGDVGLGINPAFA